jgi:plastocyanin
MTRLLPLVLLVAAASCDARGREHIVIMRAMTFEPPTLSVASGDRVTWRNEDIVAHTATADGRFNSGEVAAGTSYTVTVKKPGEVRYRCTLHPTMLGTLQVR